MQYSVRGTARSVQGECTCSSLSWRGLHRTRASLGAERNLKVAFRKRSHKRNAPRSPGAGRRPKAQGGTPKEEQMRHAVRGPLRKKCTKISEHKGAPGSHPGGQSCTAQGKRTWSFGVASAKGELSERHARKIPPACVLQAELRDRSSPPMRERNKPKAT